MSIEDKENDVAVIVTKESTSVRGSGSPGGDKTTPDKRSNNNINNEASPFTQAMLADIAIDENGNITVLGSQTPLKEVTQQKQQIKKDETHHSQQQQRQQPTHSLKRPYEEEEEEEGSTKGGNSSNASLSVDSESLAHKKVHLSKWVDFSTSLEEDYMQTLFQTESAKCVQHGFISRQPEVTADMRATLVDWMGDVANWVPLNEETLFLAVNYVDRYLSVRGVRKANLQLLGIAALHTAGKYEEVDPASCSMLAPLAGKRETCKRVNTMELKIGVALDFDYNVATHMAFLRGLTLFDESHISISSGVFTNALYLCELSLLEYEFAKYKPSAVACASWIIAKTEKGGMMSPEKAWSKRLADVTGYSLMELEPCAEALNAWKTTANEKGFSLAKKKYFNVNNNY